MKNIHKLSTDKPSRLIKNNRGYALITDEFTQSDLDYIQAKFQHIYITNDEEIKNGDWCINIGRLNETIIFPDKIIGKADYTADVLIGSNWRKIILTTDPDLIKDGVQAIDEEFLEWFVKNPSCEYVEVEDDLIQVYPRSGRDVGGNERYEYIYKIIIPQEEPKQEKKPHSFCKTPEEKCTMNYCDENGCQNRVRHLVEPNFCKDIVINDKATIDVPFHNKPIRFENLTSEQAGYLLQVSEFYQLSGTRRSAVVPQEEPKQIYYNTVGRENGVNVVKGQFNTQKEALDLANELNRKFPDLYYDWRETLIKEEPKQIKCYCGHTITCDCEPLQETFEEAAERESQLGEYDRSFESTRKNYFIKGAKWQQERMYSEEDMINFHKWAYQKNRIEESDKTTKELLKEWFEQFKKK